MERFVGSVIRKALDYFIILSKNQLKTVLDDYIHYYNYLQPHQGFDQQTPTGYSPEEKGEILKIPILSGIHLTTAISGGLHDEYHFSIGRGDIRR